MYKGIMGDRDGDGIENADDIEPNDPNIKMQVEQVKFTDTFKDLLNEKQNYDEVMYDLVGKMDKTLPSKYKVYARTKTPFSIIKKLVEKRIKGSKGLTDMIGTTIVVNNNKELKSLAEQVGNCVGYKGIYGEVLDFDDFFKNPNCGYMAYHYIVNYGGIPIEIQLKTKLMKQLNEFSHTFYKSGNLDCNGMGEVASIITEADNGNKNAQKEAIEILADKKQLEQTISTKYEGGGVVEFFDYSNADLDKLPFNLDKYFIKNSKTLTIPVKSIQPTRARKKGVLNANKFMRKAYDGEIERRKPISIYKRDGKWYAYDGNSTLVNAIVSGWKTIYADIVKDPIEELKKAEDNVKIVRI
jgi:ppGpp synthetase/RelA/SpoT-type nucleotidyltranferase